MEENYLKDFEQGYLNRKAAIQANRESSTALLIRHQKVIEELKEITKKLKANIEEM